MEQENISKIANELGLKQSQVTNTITLLEDGGTVPFIARYRKEMTGSLDETQITTIRDRAAQLEELDKRRAAILTSLEERDLLDDELKDKIINAETMAELEDIYLPFRPKKRTRATVAREKGLEPLALLLLKQEGIDPEKEALAYVRQEDDKSDGDVEKPATVEEVLEGARDIIAEIINEDSRTRAMMRDLFMNTAQLSSVFSGEDKDKAANYRDYFEWSEPASRAPSHRVLAIFRGEREGHLRVKVLPLESEALAILEKNFITGSGADSEQVRVAAEDGYKRLLAPSMENEIRRELKTRADETAIRVFADNLKELLLASPLGERRVLAIDPGYRTGCKVVCMDERGALLENATIYITSSDEKQKQAETTIRSLVEKHKPEAIAIGNGTASRETEVFIRCLNLEKPDLILMVNESGASVYSASEVAREEFPDHDITVRGAVSIGRRLMDPLAELVKIDPKSIGVGQYQHDVDQGMLKTSLDDVVISCVNNVGVDVNTASPQLLGYVSGLGPALARNIVSHRAENGLFRARAELTAVARLGPKAFEQAAGFIRIREGDNPLDASAVHPESYPIVEKMAEDLGTTVRDLMTDGSLREKIDLERYVTDIIGLPTLKDILTELARPGRDPRKEFKAFSFADGVTSLEDLEPGMKLPGVVTNVTDFGAFVDIGVHQDGLVHISQMAHKFVKNPGEIVKVGQQVQVRVLEVDQKRRRISLSMKSDTPPAKKAEKRKVKQVKKRTKRPPKQNEKRKGKGQQTESNRKQGLSHNPFAVLKDLKDK